MGEIRQFYKLENEGQSLMLAAMRHMNLFLILRLVEEDMLAPFGKDLINGHVLMLFNCRMIVDMSPQYFREGIIDQRFHTCGKSILLFDC